MCCHLVPLGQEPLVAKICHLVHNSVAKQQVKTKTLLVLISVPESTKHVNLYPWRSSCSECIDIFQIVLRSSLGVCIEYIVEGLRICPQWLQGELLRALAALLYENVTEVAKVDPGISAKSIHFQQVCNKIFVSN